VSQGPNNFENGKKDSLQRHAVLETAEMSHYGTVQILKRRTDKNDEARNGCCGPRSYCADLLSAHLRAQLGLEGLLDLGHG